MKKIILILILILPQLNLAQGEANHWYFGLNAGLDFNSGMPQVLSNGELATFEGCSTISNELGELLFYTDGVTVYNRNHQIMPNGIGLSGNFSSTHSAIIFPKPEDLGKYYIFTIDSDGGPKGLQYSIVDMALNDGLGAVSDIKNEFLIGPTNESLAAVENFSDTGYWVVSHKYNSNEFVAYEVTASGVNTQPVISAIGTTTDVSNIIGQMKIAPTANKIAIARKEEVELFDFDNITGELTNVITLSKQHNFYGVEFSPDGKLLYTSFFNGGSFTDGGVFQYSLTGGDNAFDIASTRRILAYAENEGYGAMQLAPDGRIYVARISSNFLDVIENPSSLSTVDNYVAEAIDLGEGTSVFGLPSFVASYFRLGIQAENVCIGNATQFYSNIEEVYNTLIWDFGDGNISTETDPLHTYQSKGEYDVTLTIGLGSQSTTNTLRVTIYDNPVGTPTTIVQCQGENTTNISNFNLNNSIENLLSGIEDEEMRTLTTVRFFEDISLTNEIDGDAYANISNPQIIYAELRNEISLCTSVTEVILQVNPSGPEEINISVCEMVSANGISTFDLSLVRDDILSSAPDGAAFRFHSTYSEALLQANPLGSSYTNQIPYSESIYARVSTDEGCYGIYKINLRVNEIPEIEPDEERFYCLNDFPERIILDSGVIGNESNTYLFNWSTGETTEEILVDEPGTYTVTVSSPQGCFKERVITVLPSNLATIENIEVVDLSTNNSISIIVSGEGDYVYALNNEFGAYQTSNEFENLSAGIYTIYIKDEKNDCGIVSKNISVLGYPKFFTPNGDNNNDTWGIKGFSDEFTITSVVEIYNRFGKLITILNEANANWDGTYKGNLLHTDDYWFVAKFVDGRVATGHFTLKR